MPAPAISRPGQLLNQFERIRTSPTGFDRYAAETAVTASAPLRRSAHMINAAAGAELSGEADVKGTLEESYNG